MQIRIKDKDRLINIFKTISWLDFRRWSTEYNYNFIHFFRKDLTNCEKILTHWICYITDRQMPFEDVWDKGGYVFSELIYEYSREKMSPKQAVDRHYEEYSGRKGEKKFRFRSTGTDAVFASRYVTGDYQNIIQTLEILDCPKYKRNIITYIVNVIRSLQDAKDLLAQVACRLHLLTYQLDEKKSNPGSVIKILSDDKEYDKKLRTFKKTSTKGKKRLWCSIRDYKKGLYHEIFNAAVKEVGGSESKELINIWNGLPMNQIELPGDVWNNNPLFRDNLFANVIDTDSIPSTWGMPEVIRNLYEGLKNTEEISSFYPEQLDVTFDFVPRMCDKALCNMCLFGKNGAESICIPTQDKYCPVALLSCGYTAKCVGTEERCLIKEGVSKGICKRILKWT